MLEQLKKIGKDAITALKNITDTAALEDFRIKYLGRKGQITQMLSQIGHLPSEQRREAGRLANKAKKEISEAFEQLKKSLLQSQQGKSQEMLDVTLPGTTINIGKTHVITQTINELLEIFGRMGFAVDRKSTRL